VLFNDQFKLVDEKELESLVDDVYQVNISSLNPEKEARNSQVVMDNQSLQHQPMDVDRL